MELVININLITLQELPIIIALIVVYRVKAMVEELGLIVITIQAKIIVIIIKVVIRIIHIHMEIIVVIMDKVDMDKIVVS